MGGVHIRHGKTFIQLDKRRQFYPLSLVYGSALDVAQYKRRVEPTIFQDLVRSDMCGAD